MTISGLPVGEPPSFMHLLTSVYWVPVKTYLSVHLLSPKHVSDTLQIEPQCSPLRVLQCRYHKPQFTDEETKAQLGSLA